MVAKTVQLVMTTRTPNKKMRFEVLVTIVTRTFNGKENRIFIISNSLKIEFDLY